VVESVVVGSVVVESVVLVSVETVEVSVVSSAYAGVTAPTEKRRLPVTAATTKPTRRAFAARFWSG
jgi:hypothetical protein